MGDHKKQATRLQKAPSTWKEKRRSGNKIKWKVCIRSVSFLAVLLTMLAKLSTIPLPTLTEDRRFAS